MSTAISSIEAYIAAADPVHQDLLRELQALIRSYAPTGTSETINYGMPTFRYQGNLIHFAVFKKHLGLYPGPEAIVHFAEELKAYKTSKGAIQLPLDKPLPASIIKLLIDFNAEKLKDKTDPNWHKKYERWMPCVELMNQLIVKTKHPLKQEFKWGTDIYTFQGKNVIGWGGFKDFFSLWFYNGVFLTDPLQVLISASEGKTKALRQWRFTNVKDMDERKILDYINESIQTILDGKEIKIEKAAAKKVEGILKSYLAEHADLQEAFDKLTPGKQREYIEYIEEAKQEKTKQTRLEKIHPLVLQGKGLHDKYKTK